MTESVGQILSEPFLRTALLAVVLAAIATAVAGTLAVANRMVAMGGGLAHAAYGGIGLAFLMGWAPLPVTLVFAVGCAFLMSGLAARVPDQADTLIGVLWALGMAFGILCIDLSRQYAGDLNAILFGSLLAIPSSDLWALGILDLVLVAGAAFFRKELLALAMDAEFAEVAGLPVKLFRSIFLSLLAVAVVLLMRVVGLVLMVALLSIPGALAIRQTRGLWQAMGLACLLSLGFGVAGLALSWKFDVSSGASIIAVAGLTYLGFSFFPRRRR